MIKPPWISICALTVLLAFGCAGVQFDYETPTINVRSFRALPSEGIALRFEIGLHIINPNRSALKLQGIAYSVVFEGHKILTGVASDLPVIDAYGEGDVTLIASSDLFSSVNLIADLLKQRRDTFSYAFDAKMDIKGFPRNIHVRKEGEVSLPGTDQTESGTLFNN